jgi:hypothetical protein
LLFKDVRSLASASRFGIFPVIFLTLLIILIPAYLFAQTDSELSANSYFRVDRINALVAMILFSVVILIYTRWAFFSSDFDLYQVGQGGKGSVHP